MSDEVASRKRTAHQWTRVSDLRVVVLPQFRDARGLLVPIELSTRVPFVVARLFWVGDVPAGLSRGAHAHKECRQYMICTTGRIRLEVSDTDAIRAFELGPGEALDVPPAIFASETYLEPGSMLLVLCDRPYEPDDYITELDGLRRYKQQM